MKLIEKDGKRYVFDEIRKKYLLLTPEEEVRQQVVRYLIEARGYPRSSISLEKTIRLNEQSRRYDIVVYAHAEPWMIVECKSRDISITQKTFDQVGRYNIALRVPWLYITNGAKHFVLKIDFESGRTEFLDELPPYPTG